MLRLTLLALICLPGAAFAHSGAHSGGGAFVAGMVHPITGPDHILAMVGVGVWAAMIGGRALWAMPLAFVLAMLAGGMAGALGMTVSGIEPMITASVVLIGTAAALALRPALATVLVALAVFGAAHGFAHGVEGPGTGLVAYGAGFAGMTAGLHGLGIALGRMGAGWMPRTMGLATAVAGLGLAGGAL